MQNPLLTKTFVYLNEKGKLKTGKSNEQAIRATNGCFRCVGLIDTPGSLLYVNKNEAEKGEKLTEKVLAKGKSASQALMKKGAPLENAEVSAYMLNGFKGTFYVRCYIQ